MKFNLIILSIVLMTALSNSTTAQSKRAKADSLFYAYSPENGPGLVTRVTQNGQLLYQNKSGYANLEHNIEISDTTRFLVGSISKQFTTYALLLLEAEGKLSLDDSITKYLPELNHFDQTISIRMLANHTSGLRNNVDLNSMRGRSDQDLIGQDEMVALLLRQRTLNFAPGERYQYNNTGYILLAEIIERVSEMSFSAFVAQNILQPLQMDHSQFLDDPSTIIKNKADSYALYSDGYHYIPMNRSIVGSTGLYTTAEDLNKWMHNFHSTTIGTADIFKQMIKPSKLNSNIEIPYGLGLETKIYKGLKVVFHGGGDAGYRAYSLYVPEYDLSIAVTGNYESFNPLDIAYGMIDIYLSKHIINPITSKPTEQLALKMLDYEGTYQVFPGLYVNIVAHNDSLFFQSYTNPKEQLHLPAMDDNTFKFTPYQHCRLVFSKDQFVWHFSDFAYPAKKVAPNPPSYDQMRIDDYLGSFYSNEIQTTYTFIEQDGKIIAQHPFNMDVTLIPIDGDTFISNSGVISRIAFERNKKGTVVRCKISSQNAYNVEFSKQ